VLLRELHHIIIFAADLLQESLVGSAYHLEKDRTETMTALTRRTEKQKLESGRARDAPRWQVLL
jgi:hypothetical protein